MIRHDGSKSRKAAMCLERNVPEDVRLSIRSGCDGLMNPERFPPTAACSQIIIGKLPPYLRLSLQQMGQLPSNAFKAFHGDV
ncbi:MAG: hypothetical protein DRP46_04060 [Candidatus Zixiibacteriota bacterium]|nr:MAG: hypothetical protein DRP46_04060 [candidate division Zixibacteria bacterium]